MQPKSWIVFTAVIYFVGFIFFVKPVDARAKYKLSSENLYYSYVFRLVVDFDTKAKESTTDQERQFFQEYFQKEAGLSPTQYELLKTISYDFNNKYSVSSSKREKQNLSSFYKNEMKSRMGTDFQSFDKFVKTDFAQTIKPLESSAPMAFFGYANISVNPSTNELTGVAGIAFNDDSNLLLTPCSVSATMTGPNVSASGSNSSADCGNPAPGVTLVSNSYLPGVQYCITGNFTGTDTGPSSITSCVTTPTQTRVTGVTYEQILTDDLAITTNPNTGGGRRIFPDSRNAAEATQTTPPDRRRIRVRAQYGTNTAGTRIYFRNFDPDDPSANTAPIDNETTPTGNDNNGDVDGTTNTRSGQLAVPSPNPNSCQIVSGVASCLTDSTGAAIIDFIVTRAPGDNFFVAASENQTYIAGLTLANDGVNLVDTGNAQTPVANTCVVSSIQACRSEMLTVWRRLHLERDSMGVASQNFVQGTITDTRKVGTGNQTLNLSVTNLKPNRFENGRLVIQGTTTRSLRVIDAVYTVVNGTLTPTTNSNTASSVTVLNNGTVFNVSNGTPFFLYDDDDMDDEDANLNGDSGDNVPPPAISLLQDNDTHCTNTFNADNCNVFAAAYVRPTYDLNPANTLEEDLTDFNIHADNGLIASYRNVHFQNRPTEASEIFWTVYLLGGYQFDEPIDGDPNELGGTIGRVDSLLGLGEGAFISMERNRPIEYAGSPNWQNRPVATRFTVAHEIGHLFDGRHNDYDMNTDAGLMAQSVDRSSPIFTDITLNKIRGGQYVNSNNVTTRITHP